MALIVCANGIHAAWGEGSICFGGWSGNKAPAGIGASVNSNGVTVDFSNPYPQYGTGYYQFSGSVDWYYAGSYVGSSSLPYTISNTNVSVWSPTPPTLWDTAMIGANNADWDVQNGDTVGGTSSGGAYTGSC